MINSDISLLQKVLDMLAAMNEAQSRFDKAENEQAKNEAQQAFDTCHAWLLAHQIHFHQDPESGVYELTAKENIHRQGYLMTHHWIFMDGITIFEGNDGACDNWGRDASQLFKHYSGKPYIREISHKVKRLVVPLDSDPRDIKWD